MNRAAKRRVIKAAGKGRLIMKQQFSPIARLARLIAIMLSLPAMTKLAIHAAIRGRTLA